VIVADASALVAIGDEDSDASEYLTTLQRERSVISPINYVEVGIILIGRRRLATQADLNEWLARLEISIEPGDGLAGTAMAAYLRFGRGFHPAKLNLGDCFAYALAKALDAPLLYKGDDFALTDVRSALQPT
jgi:ribonuclease VapC